MYKRTFFLVIALIVISFAGCSKSDSPVTANEPQYLIPLAVGNYWKMDVSVYDSTGNKIYSGVSAVALAGTTLIGNDTGFTIEDIVIVNRTDGTYQFDKNDLSKFIMYFKYPANIGDKWSISSTKNGTLLVKSETISVPAGTFNCSKYQFESIVKVYASDSLLMSSHYQKELFWICPGKGFIKQETYESLDNGIIFLKMAGELKEYKLY